VAPSGVGMANVTGTCDDATWQPGAPAAVSNVQLTYAERAGGVTLVSGLA
jgi:hypothetical protein